MEKGSMKAALGDSLKKERSAVVARTQTFDDKFAAAEALVGGSKTADPKEREKTPAGPRVVRDTFSMPEGDYALLKQLKSSARKLDVETNKSELVRAGLRLLVSLKGNELREALLAVEKVKPGRKPTVHTR